MRPINRNFAGTYLAMALSAVLVNCSSDGGDGSGTEETGGVSASSGGGNSANAGGEEDESGGNTAANTGGGTAANTGGTVATHTGGTTSTNTGGTTSTHTGGTASTNTGGTTSTHTGGTSANTGGRSGGSGGTQTTNTGGTTGDTGGTTDDTGGTTEDTGGTVGDTGGTTGDTGGSTGDTGGTVGDTGGTTGNTGGTGEVVAGEFEVSVSLASDEVSSAPGTVGIVQWSLAEETVTEARIEFGLDTSYGMVAPVDLNEAGYRTLLLGMKPDREYHFRVVATTATGTYASSDNVVTTGGATNLVTVSVDAINAAASEGGFIISELFQSGMSAGGNSGSVAFIIDSDGDIVWWYQSPVLTSLARARMSADGKSMWLIASGLNGAAIERISMDTLTSQTYDVVGSHDITPIGGSKMAFLEYGEADCDSIVEIDSDGSTVEVFESSDVASNQCHGNSLRYSATEDVYTFSDHLVDVYIVNRDGQVDWKLTDVVGSNSTWGGQQHGVHLLDNSILIFANQGDGNNASAIEYDLSGTEISRYNGGVRTSNLGDVQRLPGGNTLVTYSTSNEIHEIDASGNAVIKMDTGATIGYSEWRASLYGEPYDIGL